MEQTHSAGTPSLPLLARRGTMEILACGATAIVYLGTLAFGFVYDDEPQILKNPAIQSWRYLPEYFTSHVWSAIYPHSTGNYYRPLFLLWLRLNYVMFGARPAGWHATSILCHVVATLLVFRVTEQLTLDRRIAFLAALIFGLHPAHIENVAWISGVTDPLMACLVLGSCSAFLSYRESRKTSHLALSLSCFVLALLAKETAIILPLLILALAWIIPDGPTELETPGPDLVAALRLAAPFIIVVPVYLIIRYHALNGFAHALISISWTQVFLTWPSVLWFYAKHLLLPMHVSEFYPLDYVRSFTTSAVLLPLLFLIAVGAGVVGLIRLLPQKRAAWFAVILIVLPLLPVLDLRSLTVGDIVHDRYLYLPSVGFAILVAMAIVALGDRLSERSSMLVPAGLAAVVCLYFAAMTLSGQMQWANNILLYTRGLESAPDNLTVRDNLANALLGANQPDRAIPLYLDVLRRNPDFWRSNYNLGFAYYKAGNAAGAEASLKRAILIDGSDSDQYIYLALAEFQQQNYTVAAENARKAIARNPDARGYHFILGMIDEAAHDSGGAIAAFRAELERHPDNASAAKELQKLEGTASTSAR